MPDLGLVGFLRRVGTAPVLQWRIFGSFPAVGVCWGGGRGARGGSCSMAGTGSMVSGWALAPHREDGAGSSHISALDSP